MYAGYKLAYPEVADSFELLAFMVVPPGQLRAREAAMLRATIDGFGFHKPPADIEWRVFGGSRAQLVESIVKLFQKIRTQIDGYYYTFHPTTGAIVQRGGRRPAVQQSNALRDVPNVSTRADSIMRKAGRGMLATDEHGQMQRRGMNMRLRDATKKMTRSGI